MNTLQKIFFGLIALIMLLSFKLQDSEWQIKHESTAIKIEYKKDLCTKMDSDIQNEYVFLKITNKTNKVITVSFDKEAWYGENCSNCGSKENRVTVKINANESIESSCENDKLLKIFSGKPNVKTVKSLTRFELANIQIEK